MIGWNHQLSRHEFDQTLGDSEGQGSMVCCSSWGLRVRLSDWTNNILALKREIVKTKGMGLLPSFLPECKQMLKQPPYLPPSIHTHCHQWQRTEKERPWSCLPQTAPGSRFKTTMHQGSRRKLSRLGFKAETWKLKELDWEVHYLASLSFSTSQKSKDKTKPQLLLIKIKPSHICTSPSELNL